MVTYDVGVVNGNLGMWRLVSLGAKGDGGARDINGDWEMPGADGSAGKN